MAKMTLQQKQAMHSKLTDTFIKRDFDVTYSLRIEGGDTVVCTVHEADVDLVANYHNDSAHEFSVTSNKNHGFIMVNSKTYPSNFSGRSVELITAILDILNEGNWEGSINGAFDVGWWVELHIGSATRPFVHDKDKVIRQCVNLMREYDLLLCEVE